MASFLLLPRSCAHVICKIILLDSVEQISNAKTATFPMDRGKVKPIALVACCKFEAVGGSSWVEMKLEWISFFKLEWDGVDIRLRRFNEREGGDW
jgi:hypothetical protein